MKAILMSIRPEWVAKILNGEKTIHISHSRVTRAGRLVNGLRQSAGSGSEAMTPRRDGAGSGRGPWQAQRGRIEGQHRNAFADQDNAGRKADDAGDETGDISSDQGGLSDVNGEMQSKSHESAEPEAVEERDVREIGCEADSHQNDQLLVYGSGKSGSGDTAIDRKQSLRSGMHGDDGIEIISDPFFCFDDLFHVVEHEDHGEKPDVSAHGLPPQKKYNVEFSIFKTRKMTHLCHFMEHVTMKIAESKPLHKKRHIFAKMCHLSYC